MRQLISEALAILHQSRTKAYCDRLGPRPVAEHSQASAVHDDSLACFEAGPVPINDASRLLAKNQRRLLGDREMPHPNDAIQRIDCRCLDAYQHLIRSWIWVGQSRGPENLQTTV